MDKSLFDKYLGIANTRLKEHVDYVENPLHDDFSVIASEVEEEWGMSGLAGEIYESFARKCFNHYMEFLIQSRENPIH